MVAELDTGTRRPERHSLGANAFSSSVPDALEWSVAHDIDTVRDEWREMQGTAISTPFQSIEWSEAWYENLGRRKGYSPRIVVARSGGRPAILLPFALHREHGLNRLTFLGDRNNDYNAPLVEPSLFASLTPRDGDAVWRTVGRLVPEASFLSLPRQPRELGGRANPLLLARGCRESEGAHAIALGNDWSALQQEKWSKSTLRRLRQKRNQLDRLGKVGYRRVEDAAERRAAVTAILQWKSDQLDARGSRNPFQDGSFVAFLLDAAGRWPGMEVHVLELDGAPIAGAIALRTTGAAVIYQMSFDNAYERQSPGRLLLDEVMRVQVEEGREDLDLGYGDEPYKMKLTDRSVVLWRGLTAFGPAGWAGCRLEQGMLQAVSFIKSHPRLVGYYHAMRARKAGGGAEASDADAEPNS